MGDFPVAYFEQPPFPTLFQEMACNGIGYINLDVLEVCQVARHNDAI